MENNTVKSGEFSWMYKCYSTEDITINCKTKVKQIKKKKQQFGSRSYLGNPKGKYCFWVKMLWLNSRSLITCLLIKHSNRAILALNLP